MSQVQFIVPATMTGVRDGVFSHSWDIGDVFCVFDTESKLLQLINQERSVEMVLAQIVYEMSTYVQYKDRVWVANDPKGGQLIMRGTNMLTEPLLYYVSGRLWGDGWQPTTTDGWHLQFGGRV